MNDPNDPTTKGNAPPNPQADAPMARNNVPNQHLENMAHRAPANPYADLRRIAQQPNRVASNSRPFSINRFATDADIPGNHGIGPMRQRTANFSGPIYGNAGHPPFGFGFNYQPSHAAPPGFPAPLPFPAFPLQLIHPNQQQGAQQHGLLAVMANQPPPNSIPVRQPGPFDAGTSAPPDSSQPGPSSSSSSGFSDQPPAPADLQPTPEIVKILQEFESPSPAQFVLGMGHGVHRSRQEVRELREAIARLEEDRQTALDAQLAAEQRLTTEIDLRTESEAALQAANDSARQAQERAADLDKTLQAERNATLLAQRTSDARLEELQAENSRLQNDRRRANDSENSLNAQIGSLQQELVRVQADLGEQVTSSRDEARQAQQTAAALSGQLQGVRNELESAGRRTNIAIQSRNDALGQVANLERQLQSVRADLGRQVNTVADLHQQVQTAQTENTNVRNELDSARRRTDNAIQAQDVALDRLRVVRANLEGQVTRSRDDARIAQQTATDLRQELQSAQTDITNLRNEVQNVTQSRDALQQRLQTALIGRAAMIGQVTAAREETRRAEENALELRQELQAAQTESARSQSSVLAAETLRDEAVHSRDAALLRVASLEQRLQTMQADLERQVEMARDGRTQAETRADQLSGQLSAERAENARLREALAAALSTQDVAQRTESRGSVASTRAPETSSRPEQAEFGQSLADRLLQHEVDKIDAVHASMEDQPGPSNMPAWSGRSSNPRDFEQQAWEEPTYPEVYGDVELMEDLPQEPLVEDREDLPADDQGRGGNRQAGPNWSGFFRRQKTPFVRKLYSYCKGRRIKRQEETTKKNMKKGSKSRGKKRVHSRFPLWDEQVARGPDGLPQKQLVWNVPAPGHLQKYAEQRGKPISYDKAVKMHAAIRKEQIRQEEWGVIEVVARKAIFKKMDQKDDDDDDDVDEEMDMELPTTSSSRTPRRDDDDDAAGSSAMPAHLATSTAC